VLIEEVGVDFYKKISKEFIEEGRRTQLARVRQLTVPGNYRSNTFYGHVTKGKPGFQPLGDPDWLYSIPLKMDIKLDGKIVVDFEGAQPWGYHSMNCTPAGMDGGMFVTLTQHMNFEGLVNDGAWLATQLKLPKGTWTNPDSEFCATATSWALLLPAYGAFQRMLSRGFLARGFLEEVFVGQVNSPMIEMGGISQYGKPFGIAHFECAAAGSGALAIKDGLDTAYVGWNPESDMGNIEIWELDMPMVYLGRSILPNSGGAGKYRGGNAFMSTWVINKSPEVRIVTSEHSSRVFDNAGMCGGYPAPTCQKHRVVRNSDIYQRAEQRKPLAHSTGLDQNDLEQFYQGNQQIIEGPHITAPMKEGDIFTHSYNGGGGYGDPLERDPVLVLDDIIQGHSSQIHGERVHGVRLKGSMDDETLEIDFPQTLATRKRLRLERLQGAVPVKEWFESEKSKVKQGDFAPEVLKMYRAAMDLSEEFAREFRAFWQLENGFAYPEKEQEDICNE
ncbi:MAG: hydantoinase B/oxoprolinase family protein, partial [Rhodobacteraceae bacterium]|nr:hydantoinase B/oxoprolinase family protein [Paracoccaceae bacterium]